jgi:hypothetical protein
MSFLAPLFLIGALAVAAPILFHLIRRTSREKTPFSSLMFLEPTPPRVTKKSRLENILLLILRCAVLCLLALAFARPFMRKPLLANPGSGAATRSVVLIDSSASMRRENLWNDARARATELARAAKPGDEMAILSFDRNARALFSFEEWGRTPAGSRGSTAADRLNGLRPSWNATHFGNALLAAAEALDAEHNSRVLNREIVLISDFQEGGRVDGLQGFPWPKNTRVTLVPVKAQKKTNAGLQPLANSDTSDPVTEKLRVRIGNSSESTREQFQLQWAGASGATPIPVYVPPGQNRTVDAPTNTGSERLVLTGDDADFDNALFVVPPRREQVELFFAGADTETDPQQLLFYLKRAFGDTSRQEMKVQSGAANQLSALSNNVSLIVIGAALAPAETTELARRVREGATAVIPLRSAEEAGPLSALLGQAVTAEEAPAAGYSMLAEIDFVHPLFAPFADARFSDFTKIHFWKHRRLNVDGNKGRILAKFDNGAPAIVQFVLGKGSVIVFASSWQPSDSQLALSSKFVPMVYSLLELSGAIKPQLATYTVGDPVDLSAARATNALAVTKPDGKTVPVAGAQKLFGETDQPGVYTVVGVERPFRFAVNLAPEESKTSPLAAEQLEKLGVPLRVQPIATPEQLALKQAQLRAMELESNQKLWRWLIVVTLVILIVETWIAARLSRRAPVQAESGS